MTDDSDDSEFRAVEIGVADLGRPEIRRLLRLSIAEIEASDGDEINLVIGGRQLLKLLDLLDRLDTLEAASIPDRRTPRSGDDLFWFHEAKKAYAALAASRKE